MKKFFRILTAVLFCAVLLSGCGQTARRDSTIVYSFSGENEVVSISNGVIVLSPEGETIYGGNLKTDLPDISTYSIGLYTQLGQKKRGLLGSGSLDPSGEPVLPDGPAGTSSGTILTEEEVRALLDQLFFELEVTFMTGEKEVYTVPMELNKVAEYGF